MPRKKQPNIAGKKRKRPSKATVDQANENDEGSFHSWRLKNDKKYRTSQRPKNKNMNPTPKNPKANVGKKSSAKATGATRRKSNTVPQKNTKMNKVANKTRKSSAVASVSTSQPAKMSPRIYNKKAQVKKASSFDKALKLKKKKKVKRGR